MRPDLSAHDEGRRCLLSAMAGSECFVDRQPDGQWVVTTPIGTFMDPDRSEAIRLASQAVSRARA